jgi:hypothetical protein
MTDLVNLSMKQMKTRSAEEIESVWNTHVVRQLWKFANPADWPTIVLCEDLDTSNLWKSLATLKKTLKKQRRVHNLRLAEDYEARKDEYVSDRIVRMNQHMVDDLTKENTTIALLMRSHEILMSLKQQTLTNMYGNLPSPRLPIKRYQKVTTASDVAKELITIQFELFAIDHKLFSIEKAVAKCVESQHSIINLVVEVRARFITAFEQNERQLNDSYLSIQSQITFLNKIVKKFLLLFDETIYKKLTPRSTASNSSDI